MYIRLLIFSCDLLSLYPAVHFLSKWLSGILAIMNRQASSKCDSALLLFFFLISIEFLHISVSWLSLTGVWVTASFLKFFRTLLSILAVLNNAVVRIGSIRPPTVKSSSPFNNPLVTVSKAPIRIGIIVTFMFLSFFFFQFSSKVEVLILLFTSFPFYSMVSRDSKFDNFANSLFFCWLSFRQVFWPRFGVIVIIIIIIISKNKKTYSLFDIVVQIDHRCRSKKTKKETSTLYLPENSKAL